MYSLSLRNSDQTTFTVLNSQQIKGMLNAADLVQSKHIRWIEDLEQNKCRYSNQDFDVLAAAYRATAP